MQLEHPNLEVLDPRAERLVEWLEAQHEPSYRRQQILRWVYQGRGDGWESMTDLPAPLRQRLASQFTFWQSRVVQHRKADDGTEKLVLEWTDGNQIECVLLRDSLRRTICISTQAGCAMGCVFCASGLDGVRRNLTTAEIVEQMLRMQRLLPPRERLSHIVVMGMGEPLANLDQLLPALEIASWSEGLGISPRRITISTVGLPKAIDRLVELKLNYNLAVSLHAPDDALRSQLVPVNRNIGVAAILAAADRYFESSGRRLTFEYVLLGGVNDQPIHASQLGRLLAGRTAMLNLIPYNPVEGLPYESPRSAAVDAFREIVQRHGVNVQVRERKGDAISAACGQLRRKLTVPSGTDEPSPDETSRPA